MKLKNQTRKELKGSMLKERKNIEEDSIYYEPCAIRKL